MQQSTLDIFLRSEKSASQGHADLRTFSRQDALRKGLKGFLSCWVLALITLPIPLVHFVAPPILLLLGPFAGYGMYRMYRGAVDITGGVAPCPDCGNRIMLEARPERWPYEMICPKCEAHFTADVLRTPCNDDMLT